MIYDYNQTVRDRRLLLHPCVYMHNYRKTVPEKLESEQYKEYVDEAPIFARGEVLKLRQFISNMVATGDNKLTDVSAIRRSRRKVFMRNEDY